jgi:hypothetical protein
MFKRESMFPTQGNKRTKAKEIIVFIAQHYPGN